MTVSKAQPTPAPVNFFIRRNVIGALTSPLLLLTGCSGKEAACERAVKTALKNPDSYRTISIQEDYGEGKAFQGYFITFSHGEDKIVTGRAFCVYNNNNHTASADILR